MGVGGLLRVPKILGDDVAHSGDLGELVAHLGDREIEVLRTDEKHVVRFAFPHGAQQTRNEFDEAAGLLELLVLLEERDDVFQARVKRIRGGNLVGDGFRTAIGDLGLRGFLQFFPVGVGDVVDRGGVGKLGEEAFAEDVVDFVGGEVHGRDVALAAAQFLFGIFQCLDDERTAGLVGGMEVGNDDADVGFLAGGSQEACERTSGNIGDGARANWAGGEVLEVRRHFIQQDEDGFFADEEFEPGFFVGRLRTGGPEFLEHVGLAELLRNFAPEEMRWAVATIESGHASGVEHRGVGIAAAILLAQGWVLGQQAEADEQVGFAAAHGLLEMEDGLRRDARQPGNALGDEVLHALRDEGLLEKRRAVALGVDQFVELLDLVAEFDRQRVGMERAGVADGFHALGFRQRSFLTSS